MSEDQRRSFLGGLLVEQSEEEAKKEDRQTLKSFAYAFGIGASITGAICLYYGFSLYLALVGGFILMALTMAWASEE